MPQLARPAIRFWMARTRRSVEVVSASLLDACPAAASLRTLLPMPWHSVRLQIFAPANVKEVPHRRYPAIH
jgi:hypothetical protein